jgi:DNA repair protein RadC
MQVNLFDIPATETTDKAGRKTSTRLAGEMEITYKTRIKTSDLVKVSCSLDSYNYLKANCYNENTVGMREEFHVLLLNRANRITGHVKISEGGIAGTVADSRLIFSTALKGLASALILSHNHPSGNTKPSEADIQLTKKLREAGFLLEIPVLDHLIVTPEAYLSFADEGLI